MDYYTKSGMVPLPKLVTGDFIVNLGSVLEIEERATNFWIVIDRMGQRQVWRFLKSDSLLVFSPFEE